MREQEGQQTKQQQQQQQQQQQSQQQLKQHHVMSNLRSTSVDHATKGAPIISNYRNRLGRTQSVSPQYFDAFHPNSVFFFNFSSQYFLNSLKQKFNHFKILF